MPVASPRGDRSVLQDARQESDDAPSPCPLYSGHLLKLGSNDRWQSRLFTFDGTVLICIGKKPRAPVIVTYNPHLSSPFMSPTCLPHPMNPNTKWFVNITSITHITLLPTTKAFRCFPYSEASKALSIQTSDGRKVLLRASKDTELERWYFVLSKIWTFHQQLAKTGTADQTHSASQLAAHQQSAHLFQKYLQKNYQQEQQENLQDAQEQLQPEQQTQIKFMASQPPMRSGMPKARESLLPYQIPPPPRVSAFLPQGFDWSLKEQGDEDDPTMIFGSSFLDSPSMNDDRRPLDRHNSWQQHRVSASMGSNRHRELVRSSSAGMVQQQRYGAPVANAMEPAKAAIIDHWRRSLMSPLMMEEAVSVHSGVNEQAHEGVGQVLESMDTDTTLKPPRKSSDSEGRASRKAPSSHTARNGAMTRIAKWFVNKEGQTQMRVSKESISSPCPSVDDLNLYSRHLVQERDYQGHNKVANLPALDQAQARHSEDNKAGLAQASPELHGSALIPRLDIHPAPQKVETPLAKEEDELPLGLLQVNRHSRWLNTQLSSEDGASGTHRDSKAISEQHHQLLPSEPITPEQTLAKHGQLAVPMRPTSQGMSLADDPSSGQQRMTPSSLSNPTLSMHGSSYSYLPINDPDFVFPVHASAPANEAPSSMAEVLPSRLSISTRDVLAQDEAIASAFLPSKETTTTTIIKDHVSSRPPSRQLRRCPSIPTHTNHASSLFKSDHDPLPYTSAITSTLTTLHTSIIPPTRPARPPGPSPILIDDYHYPTVPYKSISPTSPTSILKHRSDLSRSVSTASGVSQVHRMQGSMLTDSYQQHYPHHHHHHPPPPPQNHHQQHQYHQQQPQEQTFQQMRNITPSSPSIHPHAPLNCVAGGPYQMQHPSNVAIETSREGKEEDEDEPLAVTLSRQQSLKHKQQQHHQRQLSSSELLLPIRENKSQGLSLQLPNSIEYQHQHHQHHHHHHQQPQQHPSRNSQYFEQPTPPASSESFSYF